MQLVPGQDPAAGISRLRHVTCLQPAGCLKVEPVHIKSLESLPHIAKSVRPIAGEKPWAAGPSAIGMRLNPYGAAPMENPSGSVSLPG